MRESRKDLIFSTVVKGTTLLIVLIGMFFGFYVNELIKMSLVSLERLAFVVCYAYGIYHLSVDIPIFLYSKFFDDD